MIEARVIDLLEFCRVIKGRYIKTTYSSEESWVKAQKGVEATFVAIKKSRGKVTIEDASLYAETITTLDPGL